MTMLTRGRVNADRENGLRMSDLLSALRQTPDRKSEIQTRTEKSGIFINYKNDYEEESYEKKKEKSAVIFDGTERFYDRQWDWGCIRGDCA